MASYQRGVDKGDRVGVGLEGIGMIAVAEDDPVVGDAALEFVQRIDKPRANIAHRRILKLDDFSVYDVEVCEGMIAIVLDVTVRQEVLGIAGAVVVDDDAAVGHGLGYRSFHNDVVDLLDEFHIIVPFVMV